MENKFDISQFVNTQTEGGIISALVERAKLRRKEVNLTQHNLAVKSGVSYSSIRRFESTGEISLSSLIKIADALDCLNDFNSLFKNKKIKSIKDL